MPGYIALIGFAGIAWFIFSLYVRRRRIESGMTDFYKEHSLSGTTNEPPFVRESLRLETKNSRLSAKAT